MIGFFFVCYVVVVIVAEAFNFEICNYKNNFKALDLVNFGGIFNTWSISLFSFQCH